MTNQTIICEKRPVGRRGTALARELSPSALAQLCAGSLACIWHRRWYDVGAAATAIERLLAAGLEGPPDETGVRNIGPTVGSALASEAGADRYFADAGGFHQRLREGFFAGLRNPFDALLEAFNAAWPAGAAPAAHRGKPFSPGVFRRFRQGASLNPHVDTPLESLIAPLCGTARLSACVYLEVPTAADGGRLELWNLFLTREEYDAVRAEDFSLPREVIGAPALSLQPGRGDLIVFDTERIHAVSRVLGGARLTASSFIGVGQPGEPLAFFA